MYHPELRPELIHDGVLPEAGEIRSQLDRRRLSGQLLDAAAQLIGQPLDHEVLGAPPGGAGDFRIEAAAPAAVGGDHAGPEAPPPPAQRAGRGALLPPPGERSEGRGGAEEEGGGLTAAGAEPEARGGRRLQNHLAAAEGTREGRHWPGT